MKDDIRYWRKYVHEVLVNRLGGLSLPRKSVVRLTDRPDMTLDVYRGCKTTNQQIHLLHNDFRSFSVQYRTLFMLCPIPFMLSGVAKYIVGKCLIVHSAAVICSHCA